MIVTGFFIYWFLAKAQRTQVKAIDSNKLKQGLQYLWGQKSLLVCVLKFSPYLVTRSQVPWAWLRRENTDLSEIHPWGPLSFESGFYGLVFPLGSDAEVSSLASCHTQLGWLTRTISRQHVWPAPLWGGCSPGWGRCWGGGGGGEVLNCLLPQQC